MKVRSGGSSLVWIGPGLIRSPSGKRSYRVSSGRSRHAPGCRAGDLHAQIKLLADANDLRRRFGLQGKSPDAAQEPGRTADLRHGKNLDLHAPASA